MIVGPAKLQLTILLPSQECPGNAARTMPLGHRESLPCRRLGGLGSDPKLVRTEVARADFFKGQPAAIPTR